MKLTILIPLLLLATTACSCGKDAEPVIVIPPVITICYPHTINVTGVQYCKESLGSITNCYKVSKVARWGSKPVFTESTIECDLYDAYKEWALRGTDYTAQPRG